MITLRKTEPIEIYQVELVLKEKTKQSPFIAVLMLAKEYDEQNYLIDPEALKDNLLPLLPIRACKNLLNRLKQQGYLKESSSDEYELTEIGRQSAIDKSFWVGEKGVYNVYISHSNLLNQEIIRTEKVEKGEDDRNGNRTINTPRFMSDYRHQVLNINEKEILIEDIESKCFQLNPENFTLEIEAKDDECTLKILKGNKMIFQTDFEVTENDLKEELLKGSKEVFYDRYKQVIMTEFDPNSLSFNRKVTLKNPSFWNNQFNSVEIEGVAFIPADDRNAALWLQEILFKGIDTYFLDDKSFSDFVAEKSKPILAYYNIQLPNRKQLKKELEKRENAFYQTAKLETIDYLNY